MKLKSMSMNARKEYLREIYPRYHQANKAGKNQILNEFTATTGYNRKYATRILNDPLSKEVKQRKNRPLIYTNEHVYYLKKIWDILDNPCGVRLQPMVTEMVEVLKRCGELFVPDSIAKKLCKMSSSTIDRRLETYKSRLIRTIHGTTKPGSLLKKQIPITLSRWNEKIPGFTELDLVAHCGMNATGHFIFTLNITDLATGWTESSASWGRSQTKVLEALKAIQARLPFKLKGIDPDNGSEFINWNLYHYCRSEHIHFTRGRPGKKNDNPYIEEKNWTHVRKIVGYDRLDTLDELNILNSLYSGSLRLYMNYFQPVMRLKAKNRIGGLLKKQYDDPKTPYQRLLRSRSISKDKKQQLTEKYLNLNPVKLKADIQRHLTLLRKLVKEQKEKNPLPRKVTYYVTQRIPLRLHS